MNTPAPESTGTRVLCLYLPSNAPGLRTLAQVHDTATLALKEAPSGARFDHLLLACGYSGGSPRVRKEDWNAGTIELYLASPLGHPYTGTSLLNGEERKKRKVLYPWRQAVELAGHLSDVALAGLPSALSDTIRASGITHKAVALNLTGSLTELLEQAAGQQINHGWDQGRSFTEGRAQRQTRGTGRSPSELDDRHLQDYAQAHFRTVLEAEGYVYTGPGPGHQSAVFQQPDGQPVRAHFHASLASAGLIPLTRYERFWHHEHLSLLGVLRDVHHDKGAYSGGQATLIRDWTIDDKDLRPTKYIHLPGKPTAEIILD